MKLGLIRVRASKIVTLTFLFLAPLSFGVAGVKISFSKNAAQGQVLRDVTEGNHNLKILDKSSSEKLTEYYQAGIQSHAAAILKGEKKPQLESYRWLKAFTDQVRESRPQQQDLISWKKTNWVFYSKFLKKHTEPRSRFVFVDRSYVFFRKLMEVNKILDFELFPSGYLTFAPSEPELVAQAQNTVRANEKFLRENYHTLGYKNPEELIHAVKASTSKAEMLINAVSNRLIVTVRKPEAIRERILLMDFQNSRVTSDANSTTPDTVEARLTRQNLENYVNTSDRYKPRYGEARPDFRFQELKFESWADAYGEDMWIVKNEVLNTRATFTPFDSAGSEFLRAEAGLHRNLGIPWSHRELMLPDLITEAEAGNFKLGPAPKRVQLRNDSYPGNLYLEVQIWGPLSIDDLAAFAFTKTPPSSELLEELRSRGIKVFDARKFLAVPY
jgi:hypothetical protein